MFTRILILLLSVIFSVSAGARSPTASLIYTPERIVPLFEDGRSFVITVDGIEIVGVEVGPADGIPAVLSPGFSMSFPYMRKFVESLTKKGFRVFAYNPPGQGRDALESGASAASHALGIDGMLKAFTAVREIAYRSSGKKKVVVIGHSLAGLQVRAGSLGILFNGKGDAYVSPAAFKVAREQTALIVPIFSLPLYNDKVWDMASRLKATLLKDIAPILIECVSAACSYIPNVFGWQNQFIATQLKVLQDTSLLKGEFGAPDPHHDTIADLNHFLLPHKISRQIRIDLERWAITKRFTTSSGFDFGAEWKAVQESDGAFPVFYIGGEFDSVTEFEPFAEEAKGQRRARLTAFQVGHLGAFISQELPNQMAGLIRRATDDLLKGKCERWLLDHRP